MSKIESRRQKIVELVGRKGFASIDELSRQFGVTPQTLRRDINDLAEQGLLARYHGGAALNSSIHNTSYDARQILNREAKRRIGEAVAARIPNGASLFVNIGTTTEEVARALADHDDLRIITNNVHVAEICGTRPGFEVIIAGGVVRRRDLAVVGEAAVDFVNQFRVDYGIIGISGIEEDGSLMDYDYREVRVARAIIANSRRVFLCADTSKFGRRAMVRLGGLDEIDTLFTDRVPDGNWTDLLALHDVKVESAR